MGLGGAEESMVEEVLFWSGRGGISTASSAQPQIMAVTAESNKTGLGLFDLTMLAKED